MRYDPDRLVAALDREERIRLSLRSLYLSCGYTRYRMSKFEEYDLYARNKDYLISENVITFTDTNGKLMALKPDVTLSIVKNHRDDPEDLLKLCYNENVYRVAGGGGFREIPQAGLECIGRVDEAQIGEVLLLAAESLALCSENFVLEVSDLDILTALIERVSADAEVRRELFRLVGAKNRHGIEALGKANGLPAAGLADLLQLLALSGTPGDVLPALSAFCGERSLQDEFDAFAAVLEPLAGTSYAGRTRIDFSAIDNLNYYNGVLLRGFVQDIPQSVLSGGQYDKLMQRMGRRAKAVGFAVYLDGLDRLPGCSRACGTGPADAVRPEAEGGGENA